MKQIVLYENDGRPAARPEIAAEWHRDPAWDLYLRILGREEPGGGAAVWIPDAASPAASGRGSVSLYPSGKLFAAVLSRAESRGCGYSILSNGRYLKQYDEQYLRENISLFAWDVLSVRLDPSLDSGKELIRLTPAQQIVGFRRLYEPGIEPDACAADWPALLFIKPAAADFLKGLASCGDYPSFVNLIKRQALQIRHLRMGGRQWDLAADSGLLELLHQSGGLSPCSASAPQAVGRGTRIIGNVHIGRNVQIGRRCTLVGPAVLSDDAVIGDGCVLHKVWVGGRVRLSPESRCQNRILLSNEKAASVTESGANVFLPAMRVRPSVRWPFRKWSIFSYPVLGKRIFDLIVSGIVLVLFLPFLLIIAGVLKLTSPGPVFYRARRQGLHGKEFDCLKFRTMMLQADAIQDRLRAANQVDGPQFKIEDDPRITRIGRFLRDTSIDEIPQFFNVLWGQMSVVGPRPSPENENVTCPYWRDARLSVRPGITGLWQIMRTRQVSMDFQEWIYHDTAYVRRVSFGLDLWICLKTAQKLIHSFLDQFG